jgi:hypothetical protein
VARGNATSCGHERLCVVSRYCEDSALCIGAHGTALGRSLSKHPLNKTSQREYVVFKRKQRTKGEALRSFSQCNATGNGNIPTDLGCCIALALSDGCESLQVALKPSRHKLLDN